MNGIIINELTEKKNPNLLFPELNAKMNVCGMNLGGLALPE